MNSIDWKDIERITHGKLGRTVRTPCPFCSGSRRQANQKKPVFAVKLKEPDFAIYNCAHCGESGYVHAGRRSAQVIDLTERKRLRDQAERREREDTAERTAYALKIWNGRQAFVGSRAETYLRVTRGLGDWIDAFDLDLSLGFHPSCPFRGERLPCMVALVRNIQSDEPQALHRTALKLGPRPERLERLSLGPIRGGAIKLSADGDVTTEILIGEGIETTLSASLWLDRRPAWSVISKTGIENFPIITGLSRVIVAVDNDQNGDGQRAASNLIRRITAEGIAVSEAKPDGVKDFNDLILRKQK